MVQAYNYLIESFQPNRNINYRASKRSELKKVYSSIVNLSKRSPLYKINLTKENQDYAIGIKEAALDLRAKIGDINDPVNNCFRSKAVSVSNERILSAKLISENTDSLPKNITIKVDSLASNQFNKGKELFNPSKGLEWGTYDFTANVMNQTYPLSFTLDERTENRNALQKMTEFLNRSLPQITAAVEKGGKNEYGRISIMSDFTGSIGERAFSFNEDFEVGIVDFFGLNRMEKAPSNANFDLNGISKHTTTNSFTIENTLQITLHNTGNEPVTLQIVPDRNQILSQVDLVMQSFNGLISIAKTRTEEMTEHIGASKLISELKSLEKVYHDELEACGLISSDLGMLSFDDSLASQASEDGGMESLFTRENGFIARVLDKAETITINPMDYLDKTIVTYPDNRRAAYANPYITSMYSGLFFNSYC